MKELTLFTLLTLIVAITMIAVVTHCEKIQERARTEARP